MGIFLSMIGCSEEDPQFRIRNDRLDKANVQLQTTGGNTININDVASGQTTGYQTLAEGSVTVTAVIQNESASPSLKFNCEMDEQYTVVIQTGNQPTIRIEN